MRLIKIIFIAFFLVCFAGIAFGGDFDYLEDMNSRAHADMPGFKADLSAKFKVPKPKVTMVINSVDSPADAYMVFRVGQISHQPPDIVLSEYKANKGKGWGVIAKNLGIKPGSKEFHALKKGDDLASYSGKGKTQNKVKVKVKKK